MPSRHTHPVFQFSVCYVRPSHIWTRGQMELCLGPLLRGQDVTPSGFWPVVNMATLYSITSNDGKENMSSGD